MQLELIKYLCFISTPNKFREFIAMFNLLGVDIKHRYLINSNCLYDFDSYFTALFTSTKCIIVRLVTHEII
jgi:hypothetical protein